MELIRGEVMVELEDIGEGWDGDFNPDDPEDTALLRFTVSRRQRSPDGNVLGNISVADWEQVDDASYCTQLPADLPEEVQQKALEYLMGEVYDPVSEGHSIKKLCERLSWISPKTLEAL